MRRRRSAGLLTAACALLLWPAAASAQQAEEPGAAESGTAGQLDGGAASPRRALASNGAIIAMPELSGLDCSGMAEALGLIDQSRYRGPEPVPEGHPDREIFEYEHRLAAAHYHACIMSGSRLDDPGPAFSQGFEQP